jgi:D-alanyl-D-alanine carboxypeptidase
MLKKLKIIFTASALAFSVGGLLFTFSVLPVWAAENVFFDDGGLSAAVVSPSTEIITATDSASAIVSLDKETALRGYSLSAFDGKFKLSFDPETLSDATNIEAKIISEDLPAPWKLEKISEVYQYDLSDSSVYDSRKPLTVELAYTGNSNGYKRIFFYDNNYQSWRELPTVDSPNKKIVTAKIFLPYARLAVFTDPLIMTTGKSSWYAYKNGNFAASVDFPKGSKLRVYNIANNKFVDITVNDFGPERDKFPDRILDLDKVAFKKIAPKSSGVISIRIQPLYVAPDASGKVLGVSEKGALAEPDIKAASAIVIDEKTGQAIWEKNPDTVLQLASLSKLIAIKVFFDQHPSLNTTVQYKKQDELYNYEYCKPEESAKLTVKDGETMTVENLVYAALVGSANNAVESLVRVSGLTRDNFIAKMNEYAVSVGATSTHFAEPTGLSTQNVSTAREYAIMIKEIFKNPVIQKISVTPKYKFITINTKKPHTMSNTNNFIRDGVFAAANNLKVTGSKTGYLDKYNLMTRTAAPGGQSLIAVDFGADTKLQSLEETKELLQYGMRKMK